MTDLFHKKKTLRDALDRCNLVNKIWRNKLKAYTSPLLPKLNPDDRKQVEALLGLRAYGGPIRASDISATRKFGRLCAEVVDAYFMAVPTLRWFHVTLLAGEAQTSERKPGLALKRLKAKAYKELRELGLDALGWIDEDALPNYPQGGDGGTFLFHVHATAFTDRKDFDLHEARQQLKRSRSWSCSLGAPPTEIIEITSRMGTPGWWAQYDSKPPYRAKNRIVLPDGGVKLRPTKGGYRGHLAMRLNEGLAQMTLFDTFFAVGEGRDLREEVRKRLMRWHRNRWRDRRPIEIANVKSVFPRLWVLTRVVNYERWSIIGASV